MKEASGEHGELESMLRGILSRTRGTATMVRNQITTHRAVACGRLTCRAHATRLSLGGGREELTAQLAIMSDLVVRLEELLMAGLEEKP